MDESSTGWIVFLVLMILRVCVRQRLPNTSWQSYVFQWYFWATIAIYVGICHSVFDIAKYDYWGNKFLIDPQLQHNVPDLHIGKENSLELPYGMKLWAMTMPLVGLGAVLLCLRHVRTYVLAKKRQHEEHVQHLRDDTEGSDFKRGSKVTFTRGGQHRDGCTIQFIMPDGQDDIGLNVKVSYKEGGLEKYDWCGRGDLQHDVVEANPWSLDEADELILLMIIMPAFFMVMATFALIRCLEVFVGTSFQPGKDNWDDYVVWRRSTRDIDLACAAAFQYFTVCAFARLCMKVFSLDELTEKVEINELNMIVERNQLASELNKLGGGNRRPNPLECSQAEPLQKANTEHKRGLSLAGLQGIFAYILVGFFRSVFAIITAVMVELKQNGFQRIWLQATDRYQPVFWFTSCLCIYNWSIIQSFPDVQVTFHKMPTRKFIAVRLLILFGDLQKSVLMFVSTHLQWLSSNQAELTHILLLMCWCSLVIVWNFFQWGAQIQTRGGAATPLLDARG